MSQNTTECPETDLHQHQKEIGELYDADPTCWHELDPDCSSGIKCIKCGGWFCF